MNVEIYTRVEHCPFCLNAKALLNEKGIHYTEKTAGIDITKEELKAEVLERSGVVVTTVPVIFIDNRYIGGFTDLVAYFERASDVELLDEMDDFEL